MNTLVADQVAPLTAVIEQAGVPALRVAFTIAVLALAGVGLFIFQNRHQLFDRDPNVEEDIRRLMARTRIPCGRLARTPRVWCRTSSIHFLLRTSALTKADGRAR